MRNAVLGLALLGVIAIGTSAHAGEQSIVQPVYWDGYGCGPRCHEHEWRRHERWEAHRAWHHRHWEERHYSYYAYPRY